MRLRCCASALSALLLSFALNTPAQAPPQAAGAAAEKPAYASDPKFQAAMAEGAQLQRRKQFAFAGDSFKKANKLAGGRCMECLRGLYGAQMSEGRRTMMEALDHLYRINEGSDLTAVTLMQGWSRGQTQWAHDDTICSKRPRGDEYFACWFPYARCGARGNACD